MASLALLLLVSASMTAAHRYRGDDVWSTRRYDNSDLEGDDIWSVDWGGADGGEGGRCDRMEANIARLEEEVNSLDVNANLNGLWVSQECEVRPGPQFLVRSYRFARSPDGNGSFSLELRQFHYSDRQCRRPLYAATVRASARVLSASALVPGATRVAAAVRDVVLVPHTQLAAEVLQRRSVSSCPWQSRRRWLSGGRFVVFNATDDVAVSPDPSDDPASDGAATDCLHGLKLTFGELRLLRLESRPVGAAVVSANGAQQRHHRRTELLLGDVHTDGDGGKTSKHYRPTAMQPYSLLKAAQVLRCKPCQRIAQSTSGAPALLPRRPLLSVAPEGQWISRRCETRPNSFFLRRRLDFRRNRNWSGNYSYYADARCTRPIFVAFAQGRYMPNGPSHLVDGGSDYDFKITRVRITPLTSHLAANLRATPPGSCGADRGAWRAGRSVDITATGGCAALGLKLPLLERELVKVERELKGDKLLLYLGQIATDSSPRHRRLSPPSPVSARRPTSYQPPLLQCRQPAPAGLSKVPIELLPEIRAAPLIAAFGGGSAAIIDPRLVFALVIPLITSLSVYGSC